MKPRLSYIICTTPRSGSWMLCSLLWQTGIAGRPSEFFGPTPWEEFRSNRNLARAKDVSEYMDQVVAVSMTANGVFGTKLIANQTHQFLRRATEHRGRPLISLREALEAEYPGLRYVLLTRENKVAQAISYYRSVMTGVWQSRSHILASDAALVYDHYALERCYQDSAISDAYWEGFFRTHGIEPLRLTYEALTADFEGEARRVLRYLDLPTDTPIASPQTVKLADDISREWEERFRRDGRFPAEPHLDPQSLWAPY